MRNIHFLAVVLIGMIIFSCKQKEEKNQTSDATEPVESIKPQELIFSKGEKITNDNFIGDAWVEMLVVADSVNRASPDQEFIQVAITSRVDGPTEWLDAVTDEEYTE